MDASVRQKIADALATVDDIAPSTLPPETVHPYLAWPVWISTGFINKCITEDSVVVYVVLPGGDIAATVEQGDTLTVPVAEALNGIAQVTRVSPVRIAGSAGGNEFDALRFEINI